MKKFSVKGVRERKAKNAKNEYLAAAVALREANPLMPPDEEAPKSNGVKPAFTAAQAIAKKRIDPRPPDPIPTEPKYSRIEIAFSDDVPQITAIEAAQAIKNIVEHVRGMSIRSMDSNVPDLRIDVFLVGHGYQIDCYTEGQKEMSECRDFSGMYVGKQFYAMRAKLGQALLDAVEAWKKGL